MGTGAAERAAPILPPGPEGREEPPWDPQLWQEAGSLLQGLTLQPRQFD